jgi:flagellar assembly protein FliH
MSETTNMSSNGLYGVEPFVYRETADRHPAQTSSLIAAEPASPQPASCNESDARARERRALEMGLQDGEARARERYTQALVQAQSLAAAMAAEFERERGSFFKRVEGEVVRLALSIARKIIHREAQLDPLLLAGVAKVALEHIATGSVVRLCVNPQQIESWREFFSVQSGLHLKLEWMGDSSLDPSQCRLETTVGTTSASLEDQLNEISQGFFDLLAEKPE